MQEVRKTENVLLAIMATVAIGTGLIYNITSEPKVENPSGISQSAYVTQTATPYLTSQPVVVKAESERK
ncbi:hypothetical protein HYV88_06400 [Candidatus Woesearchaeota archaeon]|nr:hypothetical protein [Candidatus Woesearchaeota archaeon]